MLRGVVMRTAAYALADPLCICIPRRGTGRKRNSTTKAVNNIRNGTW